MKKQPNAHISLHITNSNPNGKLVVQPRNADGTFRRPVAPRDGLAMTFHLADYTMGSAAFIQRSRLKLR